MGWGMKFPLPLLFGVTVLFGGGQVEAATYYVSKSGADANPGTEASPWLTIQKAAGTVVAGDTVYIRGNGAVYNERVTVIDRDGTAAAPIKFTTYPGDPMAVIETTISATETGEIALFTIANSDYVTLQNLELRNCKTTGTNSQQKAKIPLGLYIHGDGAGLAVRGCKIHDIWQSCTNNGLVSNGLGILVSGDAATAIDGLVLDGNEVYNLRTGASESVTLNGNVTNFQVTNNTVHDGNNIGIDFIGFEGTNPTTALDQVRFGVCSGNTVYNIDSKFNPAYGGNFTTGGNDDTRAAPGLYVDGGRDIVLERNHVYLCNFAVSIGSEHQGKLVTNVSVRDNILHHCHVGGIVMGGSDTDNGGAGNCSFTHNTLYQNDTAGYGGGQISIQENVSNVTIQRNLMATTAGSAQYLLKTSTTGSFTAGSINWNYYQGAPGSDYEFIWNGTSYDSFANWKAAAGLAKDANSTYSTATLGLVNAAPTSASPASDFGITRDSPLRDTGDSAAAPFTPAAGEKDFFGHARVSHGRVDIGAVELALTFAIWSLDTTGTALAATADGESDGLANLLEYGLRTSPTARNPSPFTLPAPVILTGGVPAWKFTFPYEPEATDLIYTLERSVDLAGWNSVYRLDPVTGSSTQPAGVSGEANAVAQIINITITDLALFAPPNFWRLNLGTR